VQLLMGLYLLVIQKQLLLRSTIDLDLLVSEIRERSQERKGNATRQEEEEKIILRVYLLIAISLSIFYSNEQQFTIAIVVVSLIKVILFPVYSTQLVIASR